MRPPPCNQTWFSGPNLDDTYVIELTVPWEDAVDKAYECKRLRYTIRGYVDGSTLRLLWEIGVGEQAHRRAIKDLPETAERSCHWLWLKMKDASWATQMSS